MSTGIEWTDETWNVSTGCTHVSDGCKNCYAEALSLRFGRSQHPWTKPFEAENVQLHPDRLIQPLKWRKPRKIFVDSMSDLFHPLVPDDYIDQVFAVMAGCPWHTFQVLTKRPERMHAYLTADWRREGWIAYGAKAVAERFDIRVPMTNAWPLPNVWLGTSVEDQRVADRIDWLIQTPAAVRFLSCEPLLGPLDLTRIEVPRVYGSYLFDALAGFGRMHLGEPFPSSLDGLRLHWVIAGGESGPHHRPFDPDWARSLRDQCLAAEVPFFFKQVGGRTPKAGGRLLDGREWSQFPEVYS